jgi:hypothetical protein
MREMTGLEFDRFIVGMLQTFLVQGHRLPVVRIGKNPYLRMSQLQSHGSFVPGLGEGGVESILARA